MKVLDIVNTLRREGHSVQYYVRKDGGILIKEIDGIKFEGAKGNIYAREIVGEKLSTRRSSQLEEALKRRHVSSKTISSKLRSVQKKWAKRFGSRKVREAKGKSSPGSVSAKQIEWIVKNKGEAEAMAELERKEQYAMGIAYQENVQRLIDDAKSVLRMVKKLTKFSTVSLEQFISICEEKKTGRFKEEWISPCNDILYDIQERVGHGMEAQEFLVETEMLVMIVSQE